jgi:hypothetical protein
MSLSPSIRKNGSPINLQPLNTAHAPLTRRRCTAARSRLGVCGSRLADCAMEEQYKDNIPNYQIPACSATLNPFPPGGSRLADLAVRACDARRSPRAIDELALAAWERIFTENEGAAARPSAGEGWIEGGRAGCRLPGRVPATAVPKRLGRSPKPNILVGASAGKGWRVRLDPGSTPPARASSSVAARPRQVRRSGCPWRGGSFPPRESTPRRRDAQQSRMGPSGALVAESRVGAARTPSGPPHRIPAQAASRVALCYCGDGPFSGYCGAGRPRRRA